MAITTISVEADYCFGPGPLRLNQLGKVNFIFAPNGAGKSTISKALAEQPIDPTERENWSVAPTDLKIRVFNEAYRSKVLREHVDGIFTIGETTEAQNEIDKHTETKRVHAANRAKWNDEIGLAPDRGKPSGLRGAIAQERTAALSAVFEAHKSAPEGVREIVFDGFRGSREVFFKEALKRFATKPAVSTETTWELLAERAVSLTGDQGTRDPLLTISTRSLITAEGIEEVGKESSSSGTGPFAALIQRLDNEAWVSQGRAYIQEADGHCPFCQRRALDDLEARLREYFAGGFDAAQQRAEEIKKKGAANFAELKDELTALQAALKADSKIELEPFEAEVRKVQTAMNLLMERIEKKADDPTQAIQVTDVRDSTAALVQLIDAENQKITQHNQIVAESAGARKKLVEEGWALFLHEPHVSNVLKRFTGIEKSKTSKISKLLAQIEASETAENELDSEIRRLLDSVSNTVEVAERINKLLTVMGFHRFRLQTSDTIAGGYRIVREDGTTAVDSLSEGEKSFICFAYFWESLHGSASAGEQPENVVAVVDDPISSLDSDSLFIVAAYLRKAAELALKKKSNVHQLIVLTHNTQFHHEAAYGRSDDGGNRRYFRLLKTPGGYTIAKEDGGQSKIRGTYPRLWDAVVEAAQNQDESEFVRVSIMNIVRRIIEGYFKTVGAEKSYKQPKGLSIVDQRVVCMFNIWADAGSHTIVDDIDQTIDVGGTVHFLKLFQRYFDLTGHSAHFDMMVRASTGAELLEPEGIFSRSSASNNDV